MADPNDADMNIKDLQSFPVLTKEIDYTDMARPATSPVPGAAPLGQIIEVALRDVLAWRPRAGDAQGFLTALNQAFSLKELEGHTVWEWTPRSYAVQHEMGAVTGAQASIYARARAALDQVLPLLEGLYPLRADADLEDDDSVRAVVRSNLTELVGELGVVGGPRVQRVDDYFESLLGPNPDLRDPERVGGGLGMMRERFGMERSRVNMIPEEQNLTNFIILVDQVNALRQTWNEQRHFFDRRGTDVFLGTHLVILSRALSALAESVYETYLVMDSVFLGPSDRETTSLNLEPGKPPITIAELLRWVERFASEEGPRMIREAGKDGVIAFRSTVERLYQLVEAAWKISQQPSPNPQRGFHTGRTQTALEELTKHLQATRDLTDQLKRLPPLKIVAIDPATAPVSGSIRLTIDGENFQPDALVWLTPWGKGEERFEGTRVTFVSSTQLRATFDWKRAAGSQWAVSVRNPDGVTTSAPQPLVIEGIAPSLAPKITAAIAAVGEGIVALGIEGERFHGVDTVKLITPQKKEIKVEDFDIVDASHISAHVKQDELGRQRLSARWGVVVVVKDTPSNRCALSIASPA
jgi:hypothetical protein